ncbi:hypothetical protein [Yersinia aldovae]|uniref:hypothetical protein n=1 Tax=Yersinia aldovae TaxID=29483 RepID=UPI00066FD508|nr:hypothetical protein [Yersinia aldovae]
MLAAFAHPKGESQEWDEYLGEKRAWAGMPIALARQGQRLLEGMAQPQYFAQGAGLLRIRAPLTG